MDFFIQHSIILVVLVPLLAAPLAMLFVRSDVAFWISWTASVLSLLSAGHLVSQVLDGSVLSYHLGGWVPPLGIEYRVDAANALVLLIISFMATITLPYARKTIEQDVEPQHHTLFYACLMLCITGLLGVTATGDAFNVFVFLEISSLSTYVLVALGAKRDQRALSASYNYLILGTIGATFFVIGLGLLYMTTGTLNMADMASRLTELEGNRTVRSAFAFIVVGLGLKLAIYPLHRWLPGAYAYAPSAVSAFLAATATKVALYVLLRFMFSVYSAKFGFEKDSLELIILPFAVIAMFIGSLIAIYQVNVKRLLAYSSIAQIGYMLLGLSLLTVTGVSATMVHMFNHAVTKGALFMAVGALIYQVGATKIPYYGGLAKMMPWTCAAIVLGGLSLIGVPGTVGFVSKWVLLEAALEKGWWFVAVLIVLSSLLAIIYVWRLVETLYLQPAVIEEPVTEAPLALLVPTWILIATSIWFGIDADLTVTLSEVAANSLLSGGFSENPATIVGSEGR